MILLITPWLATANEPKILRADEIAQKLKFYRALDTLKTDFVQTKHLSEMDIDIRSEGKMNLKAPTDVTWEILRPSHVKIKIDREGFEIDSGSGKQTFKLKDLSNENAARGLGLLLPWLTLDAKALSEKYHVVEIAADHFEFTPKNAQSGIGKMEASLTPAGALDQLKLFESSGDTLSIQFLNPRVTRKTK